MVSEARLNHVNYKSEREGKVAEIKVEAPIVEEKIIIEKLKEVKKEKKNKAYFSKK